jgi:hypothetical protein
MERIPLDLSGGPAGEAQLPSCSRGVFPSHGRRAPATHIRHSAPNPAVYPYCDPLQSVGRNHICALIAGRSQVYDTASLVVYGFRRPRFPVLGACVGHWHSAGTRGRSGRYPVSGVGWPETWPRSKSAGVAELVDALDLGSSGASRGGSNPSARTTVWRQGTGE